MLSYMEKKISRVWNQSRNSLQEYEMETSKYRIFCGSEKNFVRHGACVLEESISLFHGKTNPIRYFSANELNNMNVEHGWTFRDGDFDWYPGSWDERLVLVKMPNRVMIDPACCEEIQLRLLREIVVATQMATHSNVHKLLGCCLETGSPVLVYEWVAPGTLLDHILHKDTVIEWKDRLRIAWEISHAVSYLHTAFSRPIIHRDLKPTSVFLNHERTAYLCNFSLCVSIPEGEEFVEPDEIIGTSTRSYMAPEYAMCGIVAETTDVYPFGVLLLVLLTGKKSFFPSLTGEGKYEWTEIVTWVRNGVKDNCISKILDPAITRNGVTAIEDLQLRAYIHLALMCIAEIADSRPTMVDVATKLKNIIKSPESIPITTSFQKELIYKIFRGSTENFMQNEALVSKEINSLFQYGKATSFHYFSIDDLNNLNVEYNLISWDWDRDCAWYKGSLEGRAVLVKLQKRMSEGVRSSNTIQLRRQNEISNKIQLRLVREIVVATQMSTHYNVQKLLGCCLETKFPVLVYESVAAETLKDRVTLMGQNQNNLLEWKDRLRVAWEISLLVSYLHTAFLRPIIHRYLEPDNIFLDQDNTAKLSKFNPVIIPEGEAFVVEEFIIGSRDYMAPEYHKYKEVAECTDVYSLGMLLLVLLTGKDASFPCTSTGEGNVNWTKLINWVTERIGKECISEIVDPHIKYSIAITEANAAISLALRCTAIQKDSRPTMEYVATELNNMIRSSESTPSTSSGV